MRVSMCSIDQIFAGRPLPACGHARDYYVGLRFPEVDVKALKTGQFGCFSLASQSNLIGFLGSDAEVRSNANRSFTTLSLATKSSYKKDGKCISHTQRHRCVVFGKLTKVASTLNKGVHIRV